MLAQDWKVCSLPNAQLTYGLLTNGVRFPSVRSWSSLCKMSNCGRPRSPPIEISIRGYKSLEALLKGAHHIGFAFPMQSDQFKVVRFSLTGSTRAVGAMEAAIAKCSSRKVRTPETQSYRDVACRRLGARQPIAVKATSLLSLPISEY
jgi:hypothetical protein